MCVLMQSHSSSISISHRIEVVIVNILKLGEVRLGILSGQNNFFYSRFWHLVLINYSFI